MRGPRGLLILATVLAAWPAAAAADAASPWNPGDPVGVPTGDVRYVAIEREDLRLDLRAVSRASSVAVDASYNLRNDGAGRSVDLVFVTASDTLGGYQVGLDGAAVAATAGPLGVVPGTWQPPKITPGLNGYDPQYQVREPVALHFKLTLGPGRHVLHTHYSARPAWYSGTESPSTSWQFAFVLAPARQWESFGDLAVEVLVPDGWQTATSPALSRQGGRLTATFQGVPADAIALTTRYPAPFDSVPLGWWGGGLLVLALALGAGAAVAARTHLWPLLLLAAPAFAVLYTILVLTSIWYSQHVPDAQVAPLGKGTGFSDVFSFLASLAVGCTGALVGIAIGGTLGGWSHRRSSLPAPGGPAGLPPPAP